MGNTGRKKQKTDYEALQSPFMRIPRMRVEVARAFLDLGLRHLHDLQGRAPESLWADWRGRHPEGPDWLPFFRMAVYFVEAGDAPDKALMHPAAWEMPVSS